MTRIERSIDVGVPARVAYEQWVDFESLPRFVEGVRRVERIEEWLTHWETRIAGVWREFDVEIVARHSGELIAWNAMEGLAHGAMVTFARLGSRTTRVLMMIRYEPDLLPTASSTALGAFCADIDEDLQRFKQLVEHTRPFASRQDRM